jgi:hypothetical protein
MREVFDNLMKSVYTAMPATVLNVHEDGMFVDVMPVITENNQRINEVPLVFPQSKWCGLRFRVEKDDEVLLITSKYPLDNYFTRKEAIRVETGRGKQFQYGECFAIPCINMFAQPLPEHTQCEIVSEKSVISMNDESLMIYADCPMDIIAKDDIDINSTANVNIEATKSALVKSAGEVKIESATKVDVSATNVDVSAATMVNINATLINLTGNVVVSGTLTSGTVIAPNIPT